MRTCTLTRKVVFSSGHRYWNDSLTAAENKERFGRWASPYNHGHNYTLWVSTEGSVKDEDGLVVNIKDIDDVLQRTVVKRFDQKSMNDEVPPFDTVPPTTENILLSIRDSLNDLPSEVRLTGLVLDETPTLSAEWTERTCMLTITRRYEFAASHRLHVEAYSAEKNVELFGKCNNAAGHGHNYELEVTVTGDMDPVTGMLVDIEALDTVVEREIVDRYDHKNLGCDVPELAGKNATSEVVVQAIFDRLVDKLPAKLVRVRLFETARNVFEVTAP